MPTRQRLSGEPDPFGAAILHGPPEVAARLIAQFHIRHDLERFRKTGNPVFAWEAIGECLAAGFAFPTPIKAYLKKVAKEIHVLARPPFPEKGAIDKAVARAIGLRARARHNPFRELCRPGHDLMVAMDVYHYQGRHPSSRWPEIFRAVAAAHQCDVCTGLKPGTVKALWYEHAFQVIPRYLVARARSKKLDDILR